MSDQGQRKSRAKRGLVIESNGIPLNEAPAIPVASSSQLAVLWSDGAKVGPKERRAGAMDGQRRLVPVGPPEELSLASPTTLERLIARDPQFRGIGNVKARKLRQRFAERLHQAILAKDPSISGIVGDDAAASLFVAYKEKTAEVELAAWLDELRVDPKLGNKIVRVWGVNGLVRLKRNPYLLVGWVGWKSVERLARLLGIKPDDPRRLVAAVESALYARLDRGHTLTSPADLFQMLKPLLKSAATAATAPALAVQDLAAVARAGGLQPAGAAAMERLVAERILHGPAGDQDDLFQQSLKSAVLTAALDRFDKEHGTTLTLQQREAVNVALSSHFAVVGGYAGTGKTSVLKAICDVASTYGRSVHLMALSGRATRRITEATGRKATTIAGFLVHVEKQDKPLGPQDLIVVDESSMVDLPLLYRILRRSGSARILMVGDPAQLAPIGFGTPFHSASEHPAVPKVKLDHVLRQAEDTGIPQFAQQVRLGLRFELDAYSGAAPGATFLHAEQHEVPALMRHIGKAFALDGTERDEMQIIAPIRAGDAGILAINRFFSELRADRRSFPGRPDIREGDPIVFTVNDYERGLQNGSLGRFHECRNGIAMVTFDGQWLELDENDADRIELAYALSCHKAQGSQWRRVIVPVFPSRILDRSLIYTAVTRAAEQVVLIGDAGALARAVSAQPLANRRETGLPSLLHEVAQEIANSP